MKKKYTGKMNLVLWLIKGALAVKFIVTDLTQILIFDL